MPGKGGGGSRGRWLMARNASTCAGCDPGKWTRAAEPRGGLEGLGVADKLCGEMVFLNDVGGTGERFLPVKGGTGASGQVQG